MLFCINPFTICCCQAALSLALCSSHSFCGGLSVAFCLLSAVGCRCVHACCVYLRDTKKQLQFARLFVCLFVVILAEFQVISTRHGSLVCLSAARHRTSASRPMRPSVARPSVRPSIYSHRSCVRVYLFCRLCGRECVSSRLCFRVGFHHRHRFVFLDFELFADTIYFSFLLWYT